MDLFIRYLFIPLLVFPQAWVLFGFPSALVLALAVGFTIGPLQIAETLILKNKRPPPVSWTALVLWGVVGIVASIGINMIYFPWGHEGGSGLKQKPSQNPPARIDRFGTDRPWDDHPSEPPENERRIDPFDAYRPLESREAQPLNPSGTSGGSGRNLPSKNSDREP